MDLAMAALSAAWWVGFVLKDTIPVLQPLYFIPPVLVGAVGVVWLLIRGRRARPAISALVAMTAAAASAKVLIGDFSWHGDSSTAPRGTVVRVAHWNTAWGRIRGADIWTHLASDRADVCVFSEPPLLDFEAGARRLLPGYQTHVGAGMAIISRYPLEILGSLVVPHVQSWHVRLTTPDGPLDILGVDLPSAPFMDRRAPLAAIADWVSRHDPAVPLLVIGDFNTPVDSTHLAPLRRMMRPAYELAGRGWPYSWPMPVPMWTIDQIWTSPLVRVRSHDYRFAVCSDHLREIAEIELLPPEQAPGSHR